MLFYSKSTKEYAKEIGEYYGEKTCIAIGGGSVIDQAKIKAYPKRCIAVPTTASGSAVTPYAVMWENGRHNTLAVKEPELVKPWFRIRLPVRVRRATTYDCMSHAVEAYWAEKSNVETKWFAREAIFQLQTARNDNDLVSAGLQAGRAIVITPTNVIHAISYPLTAIYDVPHGKAVGMVFWEVVKFFGCELALPEYEPIQMPRFNIERLAKEAMTYPKIQHGPKGIRTNSVLRILRKCQSGR